MESNNLLVLDYAPERAEAINSKIRNSGKSIRVLYADSTVNADKILNSNQPFLILYGKPDTKRAPLHDVIQLARRFHVPVACLTEEDSMESLEQMMHSGIHTFIHADENELLIHAIEDFYSQRQTQIQLDHSKHRLDELEHRYNLLLDTSREPIAYIHEGLHIYANGAYMDALNVSDFNQLEAYSVLEMLSAESIDVKALLRKMSRGELPENTLDFEIICPDGEQYPADVEFCAARFNGEDCIQMLIRKRDVSHELAIELEKLRSVDPFTQLINRSTFTEALTEFIDSQQHVDSPSCVLYLEPDNILDLQGEIGIANTDAFVFDLSRVIKECLTDRDTAARFSDHGFAVLLKRQDKEELESIAKSIIAQYHDHIVDVGERTFSTSCSIGMATIGNQTRDADEVILHAKGAFSEAAAEGNYFIRYRPQVADEAAEQGDHHWAERIRFALNNNDVYIQEKTISHLDGDESFIEAINIIQEEEGDLKPEDYLAAAERHDLASALDRHLIPQLLNKVMENPARYMIQVSGNSIQDFSFCNWIKNQMSERSIHGGQIIFQMPFSATENNLKSTLRLIEELEPLGSKFAVSEFSDLKQSKILKHLPAVSYIKLSPELVQDIQQDSEKQETVRNIAAFCQRQNIHVIADEVGDATQIAFLWQAGVKLVAGDFMKEQSQVVGQ